MPNLAESVFCCGNILVGFSICQCIVKCAYICVHVVSECVYIYTCLCAWEWSREYVCTQMCVHICMYRHLYVDVCVCVCVCVHSHVYHDAYAPIFFHSQLIFAKQSSEPWTWFLIPCRPRGPVLYPISHLPSTSLHMPPAHHQVTADFLIMWPEVEWYGKDKDRKENVNLQQQRNGGLGQRQSEKNGGIVE